MTSVEQLTPEPGKNYIKVFRQMVFLKRKHDMTREDFQHYWHNFHSRSLTSIPIFRKCVIRYDQVNPTNNPVNSENKHWVSVDDDGLEYDGIAVLDYRSKEAYAEMRDHPDWIKAGPRLNPLFLDESALRRIFCEVHIHVDSVDKALGPPNPISDEEDYLICKAKAEGWWSDTLHAT